MPEISFPIRGIIDTDRKFRFCKDEENTKSLRAALGLNLFSAGTPCIYYGTEQAFNDSDQRNDCEDKSHSDVFLRECMFGGNFGSFQNAGRHFFDENKSIYQFIQEASALRKRPEHIALRRGRQFLREVAGEDGNFFYPQPLYGELHWVIAWSRIFADEEYLCAINTDVVLQHKVWATVDRDLHRDLHPIDPERELKGSQMTCLLPTDPSQKGTEVPVEAKNGSAIQIEVPPGGFVIYH